MAIVSLLPDESRPKAKPVNPGLRVLVVVPAEVERAGLTLMVEAESNLHVVAEAADGQTAIALARKRSPDIAIVDHSIPDVPALGLVHFLTRDCPKIQILLYTERCSRDWLSAALQEGVRAFVLKTHVGKHLAPALRALADRRPYWEDAIDDDALDELLERGSRPQPNALSSREWQVLQMTAEDRTSKEMARTLGVSPKTIEWYRARVRRKLGFRSRAELIRYAMMAGRSQG